MANLTLPTVPTFPDGTTVGAYLARGQTSASTGPLGSPVNEQVASGGIVTFTGLAYSESYVAFGFVSGQWRRTGFSVDPPNADLLAYFSASGSQITPFTAFARTLLDDQDADDASATVEALSLHPADSDRNVITPSSPAVAPLTLKDSAENNIFRIPGDGIAEGYSTEAVTSHIGDITIPAHSSVFRVDGAGNVLAGPNELIKSGSQQDLVGWDPDYSSPDFIYDSQTRRIYTRSLNLREVGDPVDLRIGRFGPDDGYPLGLDGTADGMAGILNTTSLGQIRWEGGVTPDGGVANVTPGARMRGTSALIYARAAEDFMLVGSAAHIGAHLIFGTVPVGGSDPLDRLRISSEGKLELGAAFDVNLYRSTTDVLKTDDDLVVAGANGLTVSGAGSKTTLALTSTSGATGLTLGGDVNFYRDSANVGRTDDGLLVGGQFQHLGTTLGFYGHGVVAQQVLATGAAHTVDDVITALQAVGLVKQA